MNPHSYLLDEHPHFFYPTLAERLGLNEAIVLQQIHSWVQTYKKDASRYRDKHHHDGRWWIWNSYPEWHEKLPYLSGSTIKRALTHLREVGIVVVGNYNTMPMDRTNWYAIDYAAYDALWTDDQANMAPPSDQNEPMDQANLTPPIPSSSLIDPPDKETADADFWGPSGKPDHKPITTNLPKSAHDPLDLTIKTQAAREKEKQWTVPGADDSWSGKPLQGFCVLAGRTELKDSERKHWPGQLSKWAQDWHATPDETYAAIKAIPDSEFHWMTFKTPFAPTFLETLDAMIDRIRNGQPINVKGHRDNGTQADPDLAAQINGYLKQRGAAIATTS